MPYGRSLTIRSHRRGGTRRRPSIVPMVIIGSVLMLAASGLVTGYLYLIGTWDTKTDGPTPDAWVPDSTAWVARVEADPHAAGILPTQRPSLGRSPLVMAMPTPMAEAAGLEDTPLSWSEIVAKVSGDDGWQRYGHAEWGEFRMGLSDPRSSTAGLLAVLATADADANGVIDTNEQNAVSAFEQLAALRVDASAEIINGITSAATQDEQATLTYVSAFPALEQDVLSYNLTRPDIPLVAVKPQNGSVAADFPCLVLDAGWSSERNQQVVSQFLEYAKGEEGQAAFVDSGYQEPR